MATLNYMTVPEKIELKGDSETIGYPLTNQPPPNDDRYKSMKVPDTITFETSGRSQVTTEVGGAKRGNTNGTLGVRRGIEDVRQTTPDVSSREQAIPKTSSITQSTSAIATSLEHRVTTLENKVQRLTETMLTHQQSVPTNQGNGFWYVVTFAGWMMIPLIVVFMYQYKK